MGKLSLDVFLTLVRYITIAICLKYGVQGGMQEAIIGITGTVVTMLWGFHASGYWTRFKSWLKGE